MKKILFLLGFLLLPLCALQAAEEKTKAFVVRVYYDNGQASIEEVYVANRFVPKQQAENEMMDKRFWLELVSRQGQILERRLFDFNLLISAEPPEEGSALPAGGGTFELDQAEEEVVISWYDDAGILFLRDMNKKIIDKKDLSHLATFCGDSVCQDSESSATCSQDCQREDAKSLVDREVKQIPYEPIRQPLLNKQVLMIFFLILGIGILSGGILLFVFNKNKAKKPEYPDEYSKRYDIGDNDQE